MNASHPSATKAVTLLSLTLTVLLAGCNRETGTPNRSDTAANENALPPLNPNQVDATQAPAPAETVHVPSNAVATVNPLAVPPSNSVPVPEHATNAAPAGMKEYTVLRGDTLFKIAKANKVRIGAINQANPKVDLTKLRAGQKIKIPAPIASTGIGLREPDSKAATESADANVHVVKAGETLTQIAKQHHTTVKSIQAANAMKTTRILVGQKVRLPAPSQSTNPAAEAKPAVIPAAPASVTAE